MNRAGLKRRLGKLEQARGDRPRIAVRKHSDETEEAALRRAGYDPDTLTSPVLFVERVIVPSPHRAAGKG